MEASQIEPAYIEFTFSYYKHKIKLYLDTILEFTKKGKNLKTIIKDECLKYNIQLSEDNIKLFDYLYNNRIGIVINTYDDIINCNTEKCLIVIIPIKCDCN